jgi:hypothetical protein
MFDGGSIDSGTVILNGCAVLPAYEYLTDDELEIVGYPVEGTCWFNGNKPLWSNGERWVDALGNPVDTVYPKVIGTPTTGNLVKFSGTDIEDAESKPTDYAKTSGTLTNGNFAGFDASGNIVDSGKKPTDFEPAIE